MRSVASNRAIVLLALACSLLAISCARRVGQVLTTGDVPAVGGSAESGTGSRLLITTASIEVTVASVPEAVDKVLEITKGSGGYVRESVTEKDSDARLKLRIPARRLSEVLDHLARLGEERRRHVSSEDVTEKVGDLNAELANKKALRDRLRGVLARAKDVKDVLSVENELTRVQTEIDSLEGRLKRMREDIDFSAVDLHLAPREPGKKRRILGPLGYLYVGTKWFITKLFVIRSGEP